MSKILRWKCDECGKVIPDGEGSIHIRELKQDISFHITGIIDGPFDFCNKECLLDFFAKYQFREFKSLEQR
jgi:hypothetical protein